MTDHNEISLKYHDNTNSIYHCKPYDILKKFNVSDHSEYVIITCNLFKPHEIVIHGKKYKSVEFDGCCIDYNSCPFHSKKFSKFIDPFHTSNCKGKIKMMWSSYLIYKSIIGV